MKRAQNRTERRGGGDRIEWAGGRGGVDRRGLLGLFKSGVALTQVSAYMRHTNFAIREGYAKSGARSQHVSNYTRCKRSR